MTDEMARVHRAISALDYDFRQFTVPAFVTYLELTRQRDIILNGVDFEPGLHGFWVRAETADYVFFNKGTHPVHQMHSILHELGHLILQHHPHNLTDFIPPAMLAQLHQQDPEPPCGHCRMWLPYDTPEEREAELLVRCLQREITFAGRLDALTRLASSIETMNCYVRSLGDGE